MKIKTYEDFLKFTPAEVHNFLLNPDINKKYTDDEFELLLEYANRFHTKIESIETDITYKVITEQSIDLTNMIMYDIINFYKSYEK